MARRRGLNRMSPDPLPGPASVRLVFPSDPMAVREALARLFAMLPPDMLDADARGTAEIVLTEVLNNVVEHAYADGPGNIALSIEAADNGLLCTVCDQGCPMPGQRLPRARLPAGEGADLPEGGFGWYLILSLAQDLRYERIEGSNRLSFRLFANDPAETAGIVARVETMP